ncbi:PFL_4669 family integrating conjugative element protein [Alloalcanivorax xenomutans]|uniref:Integrating conjugative element protein n=1 Tax=Alcanivorax xiamenensis TaxID=1177156 RepID=A0ABQ6Y5M3_9GAMM|nr:MULTISPECIES: TIGR03761 family integrating conjugative element protein [Alcanivoracaceae]KAF0804365.1 integrating conjugative element protein [Alcanivorax xiamenensis]WOA33486.1 TIGR03761 family integrating conjugative element protein [Alloalcanivorax xenomutans]
MADNTQPNDTSRTSPAPSSGGSPIEPGRLTNSVKMTIQTRVAQRLIHGRRADPTAGVPAIVGLYRYAAMTRQLWTAAGNDDPYADWWLLRVEQETDAVREQIQGLRQHIDRLLESAPAMDIALAHSLEPAVVELTFGTPYAYQGAYLLADLDELVLAVMTARFVGLMDRETFERHLEESGRGVRRLFATIQGYRHLAVTRDDVRQATQKGQRAIELMGELPDEILSGALRAAHAPPLRGHADTSGPEAAPEEADPEDKDAAADDPDVSRKD